MKIYFEIISARLGVLLATRRAAADWTNRTKLCTEFSPI